MPRLVNATPRYARHRATNRAVVTIGGRDVYLGTYGSPASRQEYDRLIAQWLANGRRLPTSDQDVYVVEVIKAFVDHAGVYYRRADGTQTNEVRNIRHAVRPLRKLYGRTPAVEFGPLALQALVNRMIADGWCRTYINRQVGRVKMMFKWAVSREMIPPSVYEGLRSVAGLRAGRSAARESEPVKPVPDAYVEAVRAVVSPTIRAMIDVQLVTGMRPGEVCAMRTCDMDTTGRLWSYRPSQHKTLHHGHERVVFLGERCQAVIRPFLKPDLAAYLFSPAEAEACRRDQQHAARKTPLSCGNRPGSNVVTRSKKQPGVRYTTGVYCKAIQTACRKADRLAHVRDPSLPADAIAVPLWHPHQLRHNFGTWARKEYGLETAQLLLGQKTLTAAQIYAEKNVAAAMRIMSEVG